VTVSPNVAGGPTARSRRTAGGWSIGRAPTGKRCTRVRPAAPLSTWWWTRARIGWRLPTGNLPTIGDDQSARRPEEPLPHQSGHPARRWSVRGRASPPYAARPACALGRPRCDENGGNIARNPQGPRLSHRRRTTSV